MFATGTQLFKNCQDSPIPYYRSNFDREYLTKYNALAENTLAYPPVKPRESMMFDKTYGTYTSLNVPDVVENYTGQQFRENDQTQELYSPCMNCLSIHNAEHARSGYDKMYDQKYVNLALNTNTNFAPSSTNSGLWSAN